jgi:hypothetical protein
LRAFENRVLKIILGLEREEVTEGWRKFSDEELHNLCSSPNIKMFISRRKRQAGYVAYM